MDRVAKQFTKIGKDIAIAVKAGGPSPDGNPALRRALQNARAVNMPKDKVEAAIKKASGQGAADYDIVIYEGYAPHGIALIVETATDNVTRTVANVRHHFKAHGGNMGTTGSVAFMFQKQGVFRLDPEGLDRDTLELELIDHGLVALEDGESDKGEKQLLVRCAFNDFGTMQSALESRSSTPMSTESDYVAQTPDRAARGQGGRSDGARRRARERRRRPERLHDAARSSHRPQATAACFAGSDATTCSSTRRVVATEVPSSFASSRSNRAWNLRADAEHLLAPRAKLEQTRARVLGIGDAGERACRAPSRRQSCRSPGR